MIKIPLTYSSLFGDIDVLEKLEEIENVSSKKKILFISTINYQIARKKSQEKIFNQLISPWVEEIKKIMILGLKLANSKTDGSIEIFPEWILTEYIKDLILNHDKDIESNTEEINSITELIVFIEYLKFAEDFIESDKHSKIINDESGYIDFYRTSYPSLIKQYVFHHSIEPLYQIVYAFSFLQSMSEIFKDEVDNYLSYYNTSSNWILANFFTNVASQFIQSDKSNKLPIIKISDNTSMIEAYNERILNVENIDIKQFEDRRFLLLKKFPLYRLNDNHVCITSWRFLMISIGEVIVYDFYERSGINNKIPKFLNFKSKFISLEFAEKFLFKNIMKVIFQKKYALLSFDEDGKAPDCYYRIGNRIYLFEFKDLSFSDEAIENSNFEELSEYLKYRLVANKKGESKGIGQIFKHIDYLEDKTFDFDDFTKKKVKRSKVEIFPIIVYSNIMFSFPLSTQIVNEAFDEQLKNNLGFKKVHRPVMMPLQILFKHADIFHLNQFYKIISLYHSVRKKYKKILDKESYKNVDHYIHSKMMIHSTLEHSKILQNKELEKIESKRRELINCILSAIGAPNH